MPNLQYIGARYVPIVFSNPDDDSANWKSGISYENLVIVTYLDDSYTSRKPVPSSVGNPADNPEYWAKTGDFNAALTALENQVNTNTDDITSIKDDVNANTSDLTLIKECFINALELGFKNDNMTDNLALFNSIMNDADYEGKTIYFPAGTYLIDGSISATKLIKLVGDPDTVFKETTSTDYLFIGNYVAYPYLNRNKGPMMCGITFDCNHLSSGIALGDYLDYGVENCAINNATVYGINLRDPMFSGQRGAQFSGLNLRFYNTEDNTAVAIYDPSGDSQFNNIVVVGYQVAFEGLSTINILHHWLNLYDNFADSVTLKVSGGLYTNIFCDTARALIEPLDSSAGDANKLTVVSNARIFNNTDVNPSTTIYVVRYGTNTDANIYLNGILTGSSLVNFCDNAPISTEVHGLSGQGWINFNEGQLLEGLRNKQLSENGHSINAMYNSGWYTHDASHPISDLPTAWTNCRILIIGYADVSSLQFVFEIRGTGSSTADVFFRENYNGTGQWRKLTMSNI